MDIVTPFYPVKVLVGEIWRSGNLPLWNPAYYGGIPLLANPQWGALYPGNAPFFLISTGWMFTFTLVLHAIGAAWGVWLLARRFSSPWCSLVAPVLFLFGGYSWAHYAFGAYFMVLCWVPWMLIAYHKWMDDSRIAWLAAGSLCIGMQILAGAPQIVLYAMYLLGIMGLIHPLLKGDEGSGNAFKRLKQSLVFVVITVIVGLLIGLAQIMAVLQTGDEIGRHNVLPINQVLGGSLSIKGYIASFLGGTGGLFEDAETTAYIGLAALLLVITGLITSFSKPKKEPLITYSISLILLLIYGSRIAGPLLYKIDPFYSKLHDPKRILGIAMILLPLLAARGMQLIVERDGEDKKRKLLVILLSVVVFMVAIALNYKNFMIKAVPDFVQLGWISIPSFIRPCIVSIPVLFVTIVLLIFGKGRNHILVAAIILIMIDATLFSLSRVDVKTIRVNDVFDEKFLPPQLTNKSYRYITVDPTFHYSYNYSRPDFPRLFLPGVSSFYNIQDFQGYDPWIPKRYLSYVYSLNKALLAPYRQHFGIIRNLWWSPLLGRACVKYIIGDARWFHFPPFNKPLLHPGGSMFFHSESYKNNLPTDVSPVRTKIVRITCIGPVAKPVKELMEISLVYDIPRDNLKFSIGNRKEFAEFSDDIINECTLDTKIVEYPEGYASLAWTITLNKEIELVRINVKNKSQKDRIYVIDVSYVPHNSSERYTLLSGNPDNTHALWRLETGVLPMVGFALQAIVTQNASQSDVILGRFSDLDKENPLFISRLPDLPLENQIQLSLGSKKYNVADELSTVVLEDADSSLEPGSVRDFAHDAVVNNIIYNEGKITADVSTGEKEGLLIVRQAYFKHWKARVGEKSLDIYPADHMFMGIIIPPNTKDTLTLKYSPPIIELAIILSIILIIFSITLILCKRSKKSGLTSIY
jgi:hypothetical protein